MGKRTFTLREAGTVERDERGFSVLMEPWARDGLTGLRGFSHVQVYWWAHFFDTEESRAVTKVAKPYRKGPEELGVFSTRSPIRPNPIAMTLVPVTWLDEAEGRLGVAYIDAEPGTPVVDIKPYYGMERVKEYGVPAWCAHWPAWYEDAGDFDWAAEFENAR